MTSERILSTLRFFDLQDLPLTLFEVHKYLLPDISELRNRLDADFELQRESAASDIPVDEVLKSLDDMVSAGSLGQNLGYYFLPTRENIVALRLNNYAYGIKREFLIKKYVYFLRHLPFVRGVALAGSQALGQEKPNSDIDLLVITDERYMWTARTLITLYFHVFGVRRHARFIADRFCLNHYIAGSKVLGAGRNLYAACEYIKLRPLVYEAGIHNFLRENTFWLKQFFPNFTLLPVSGDERSPVQGVLEFLFRNPASSWFEAKLGDLQKKRIHTDQYVRVEEDELSFHPHSKQEKLLSDFFELQQ